MKKKLLMISLLTVTALSFADPGSVPNNVSNMVVISDNGNDSSNGIIDLSNATSDYNLKVGETAVIRFDNQTLIPLHIAVPEPSSPTQPVIYEITVTIYHTSGTNMDIIFLPNNNTYLNQFQFLTYLEYTSTDRNPFLPSLIHYSREWHRESGLTNKFYFDTVITLDDAPDTVPYTGTFKVVYYGTKYPKHMVSKAFDNLSIALTSAIWNNTTTPWTSLGTFGIENNNKKNDTWQQQLDINNTIWQQVSGQITIKRIS
ncbi:MAG: hypothetical protein JHC33_15170 [Ignisphaera sp.]|nr:hypothetical protein [Ignisphaera sp.]